MKGRASHHFPVRYLASAVAFKTLCEMYAQINVEIRAQIELPLTSVADIAQLLELLAKVVEMQLLGCRRCIFVEVVLYGGSVLLCNATPGMMWSDAFSNIIGTVLMLILNEPKVIFKSTKTCHSWP
jgi:hypothetical protein